jgi:hypothetical protein
LWPEPPRICRKAFGVFQYMSASACDSDTIGHSNPRWMSTRLRKSCSACRGWHDVGGRPGPSKLPASLLLPRHHIGIIKPHLSIDMSMLDSRTRHARGGVPHGRGVASRSQFADLASSSVQGSRYRAVTTSRRRRPTNQPNRRH